MNTHLTIQNTRARRVWRLAAISLAGVALLAACGGDDDSSSATPAAPAGTSAAAAPATSAATAAPAADDDYGYAAPAAAPSSAPAAGAATVATAETSLGTVLVDANGRTLYAFTPDADGEPTCVDACADAWPPALVEGEPEVGDLDAALFTTVEHPLGTQLKAGDRPLYTFAGDAAPGDVNGQGSGDVWFVVAPDGTLIK